MTLESILGRATSPLNSGAVGDPEIQLRAKELVSRRSFRNALRTDFIVGGFLLVELGASLVLARWVAPDVVAPAGSKAVWVPTLIGVILGLLALMQLRFSPGRERNRYILAPAQLYMASLIGYLTGAAPENHLLIFSSIALFSLYRDWKVLGTAYLLTLLDHFARGALAPNVLLGTNQEPVLRAVEHMAWLSLEVGLLSYSGALLCREMRDIVYESASLSVRNERAFLADQAMLDLVSRATLGDLTYRLDEDERDAAGMVGVGLENMMESLGQLVKQVQILGDSVATSADELESGVLDHQATVTQQASIARNLTRSAEAILGTSMELSESVLEVSRAADETAELAARSQRALAVMNESNALVDESSAKVVKKLKALNEKAGNISSVLTTINRVADQTNLLSLNAAIEAEKAGEAGRGFGVVAQEIRRLADQTAASTLDVESMIKQMQAAVSEGVEEMDDFVGQVRERASEVSQVAEQLRHVIEAVEMMIPQFDLFSQGMDEQSSLSREISGSLNMLHEQAEGAVDSIHHSLGTLHELRDLVFVMQQGVARFKVGAGEVGG